VSSPGPPGFRPTRCDGIGPGFKDPDRRLSLFLGFFRVLKLVAAAGIVVKG